MRIPFHVAHWQAIVKDPAEAAAFYSKCFGWSIDENNALNYRALKECGLEGGIWPSPTGAAFIQLFVAVADVDATLHEAVANGAKVLFAKQVLPDGDEMAVIADPQGISWGIMKLRSVV
jgi:predicted enzyme related to lactoylglutathione lyase